MTLKVKVTIGYLLVNVVSLLIVPALIHGYTQATGFLIAAGLANMAATVVLGGGLSKTYIPRVG